MENLTALTEAALKLVQDAQDLQALERVRVEYLGKKGLISAQMKSLGKLSPEDRPAAGAKINRAKDQVQEAISTRRDRKSTRLNSSHVAISYAVFCLKKKNQALWTSMRPRDTC